jgi:hypothetical protein
MRKWLVFILLLGLMLFPAKAGAQNEIKFETLAVGLWSEYDQPSMLVINEFVLSEDTPVPAVVTIRFPKGGNLMAVAVSENGGLFNANFEGPAEQGNWQTIRINVESYDPYRVEYYQQLTRDGNKREFEYQWSGEYAVKDLTINMLIPPDSENVVSSPLLPNLVNSPDGGITGSVSKSGLTAGQSFNFKLEYTRESDVVMNPGDANSVQPSEPIGPETTGRVSIDNMPYVIGGVGVVLIVIALFFYFRSTQVGTATPRRRRRPQSGESEGQAYCHECGARARASDRFCRTCGSRLRTDS